MENSLLARCHFIVLFLLVTMFLAMPVLAQAQSEKLVIEEIIVSAQKREQSLQDTPLSVTVFGEKDIESRLIGNVGDLAKFTPNLEITTGRSDASSSTAAVYIRGVGADDFKAPSDPAVGMYVDGVFIGRTMGGMMDILDLERIEVLRGPQGTLYGKNTVGGAINLVSALPTGEFGGTAKITGGRFDRIDGSIGVDFPIIQDTLNGRVNFTSKNRNGYAKSLIDDKNFGDINRQVGRGVFHWTPDDDFEAVFSVDYSRWRQNNVANHLFSLTPVPLISGLFNSFVGAPFVPGPAPGFPNGTVFDGRFITTNHRENYATGPDRDDGDLWGVSATLGWDITDNLSVTAITSYREMEVDFANDTDASPFNIVQTDNQVDHEQISQEIRIAGKLFDERFDWQAGFFYFREESLNNEFVTVLASIADAAEFYPTGVIPFGPPGLPPPACPGFPPPPFVCAGGPGNPFNDFLDLSTRPVHEVETESYAVYAHGIYDVSDRLRLNLGLRYTNEEKKYTTQSSFARTGIPILVPTDLRDSWNEIDTKVGIEFDVNDDLMAYFQVADGFKSGGWNPRLFDASFLTSYDPEKLVSYETGIKSKWLEDRVVLNASGFYYDYTNLQVSVVDSSPTAIALITIQNAGEATVHGFEAELAAAVAEGLNVQLGVGYSSNEYDELDPGVPWTIDDHLRNAPKWSINAGISYSHPFMGIGNLTWRLDGSYKSKTFRNPQNDPELTSPSYFLMNGRVALETNDERWLFEVFATNLTDQEYFTAGQVLDPVGAAWRQAGRPQEWGISASYRF